ncbi:hypothetical protein DIPPA_10932 [Diplonema papillatum]|nr:hypothetical protein DIPPA_10932 [Diplonema papillatum]
MNAWEPVCRYTQRTATFGYRLRHKETSFLIDVLDLQFLPQALIYVDTPLRSDKGEAHTLEHVLLGKGKRAQYVRTCEEMSLATATAFTERARTAFTMQTAASSDCFYGLLKEKLVALLAPDFTDDEISHEVQHWVVNDEGEPEEKGTVYNEQTAAMQLANQVAHDKAYKLMYGAGHPLSWNQGGTPEKIRELTPQEVRAYHREHYKLSNMGAIVAVAGGVAPVLRAVDQVLREVARVVPPREGAGGEEPAAGAEREPQLAHSWSGGAAVGGEGYLTAEVKNELSALFGASIASLRDELHAESSRPARPPSNAAAADPVGSTPGHPPSVELGMPAPIPAADGSLHTCEFPHESASEDGILLLIWPVILPPDAAENRDGAWLDVSLLMLFSSIFSSGDTSTLKTQLAAGGFVDVKSVSSHLSLTKGTHLTVSLHIPTAKLTEAYASDVSRAVTAEIKSLASLPPGSPSLHCFCDRAAGQTRSDDRQSSEFLHSPPEFGVRGKYAEWLTFLDTAVALNGSEAVDVDLTFDRERDALEELMASCGRVNPWAPYLEDAWKLTERAPVTVICSASPACKRRLVEGRDERKAAFSAAVSRSGKTFAQLREEHARRMAELEEANRLEDMPGFTRDPPMEHDSALDYELSAFSLKTCPNGAEKDVDVVAWGVTEMDTAGHFGIALSLREVPERYARHLVVLPCLRFFSVLDEEGAPVDFRTFCRSVQEEVLHVDTHVSDCAETGRIELVARGSGLTAEEVTAAVKWVTRVFSSPYWRAGNLPRARQAIADAHRDATGAMKNRPEYWAVALGSAVSDTFATGSMASRLSLLVNSPPTREFALLRQKFSLASPEPEHIALLRSLAGTARLDAIKERLLEIEAASHPLASDLHRLLHQVPASGAGSARSVSSLWRETCETLAADLSAPPEAALEEWAEMLRALHAEGSYRCFFVTGPAQVKALAGELETAVRSMHTRARAAPEPGSPSSSGSCDAKTQEAGKPPQAAQGGSSGGPEARPVSKEVLQPLRERWALRLRADLSQKVQGDPVAALADATRNLSINAAEPQPVGNNPGCSLGVAAHSTRIPGVLDTPVASLASDATQDRCVNAAEPHPVDASLNNPECSLGVAAHPTRIPGVLDTPAASLASDATQDRRVNAAEPHPVDASLNNPECSLGVAAHSTNIPGVLDTPAAASLASDAAQSPSFEAAEPYEAHATPEPRGEAAALVSGATQIRSDNAAEPHPVHISLNNPECSLGVAVHSTRIPGVLDAVPATPEARTEAASLVLACMAWCGGGGHTPFVKAWNSGLAYSSGVGQQPAAGRASFYADHCPNVRRTLEFARDLLRDPAPVDGLLQYALCQAFTSRSGQRYGIRVETLAAELADGVTPAKVRAYRQLLLDAVSGQSVTVPDVLRLTKEQLIHLVSNATPPLSLEPHRFVTGSCEQIDHYRSYLAPGTPIADLHPADLWVTMPAA